MKKFLQSIFSVKNENRHKVIRIFGLKISFLSFKKTLEENTQLTNKRINELDNKFENLNENIKSFEKKFLKLFELQLNEKGWRKLKTFLGDLSAFQTAEFILKNLPTVPTFAKRNELISYALSKVEKPGLYLEFGVYQGKSINFIADIKKNDTIYGFDSFEGLPEDWTSDYPKGHFELDKLPQVRQNVKLIKGYFEDTLPKFIKERGDFDCAFINIDCDLYSSTKTIIDCLKSHISSGTVIEFDEYFNYPNWQEHEYKAFMEFIEETNLKFEYLGYVHDREKVAIRIL